VSMAVVGTVPMWVGSVTEYGGRPFARTKILLPGNNHPSVPEPTLSRPANPTYGTLTPTLESSHVSSIGTMQLGFLHALNISNW
jgi:hypothetical protein